MKEIIPLLFIGDAEDYRDRVRGKEGWAVIHADIGMFLTYLQAHSLIKQDMTVTPDGEELFIYLEDAVDPLDVNGLCIDAAIEFVHKKRSEGKKVLVHCSAGVSRSPTIVMLYLVKYTDTLPRRSFYTALKAFTNLYPRYSPNEGLLYFAFNTWPYYSGHCPKNE